MSLTNLSSYRPPQGGFGWDSRNERELDLLYLSWGERCYARTPIPIQVRQDWIYVAPRRGTPILLLKDGPREIAAGMCVVIAPGCGAGWTSDASRNCVTQSWVWRSAPRFSDLRPPRDGYRIFSLSMSQRRALGEVHDLCRYEVQNPDACTADALEILHARLDLSLARGPSGRSAGPVPPPKQRVRLAMQWLKEHAGEHAPSAGLCDYLQLSSTTLHRMFLRELGFGPREAALRLRLAEAQRLIREESWSVKATAYHLGYRHANDLSRAISRHPPPPEEIAKSA